MNLKRSPQLIRAIYRAVAELEEMFPGRHFTPDGHLIGSIGEALAAFHYGLDLLPPSHQGHDARHAGRLVQIKATQRSSIGISSQPEHLLVLSIGSSGTWAEVYNGPGGPVWSLVASKPRPKNGQYQIRLSALRRLMGAVPEAARISPNTTPPSTPCINGPSRSSARPNPGMQRTRYARR